MKNFLVTSILLILIVGGLYMYFIFGNQARAARGLVIGGDYVTKMYSDYTVAGKTCQGEDANKDGYITCNFRIKNQEREKTISLQCPTFFKSFMATSCKEQGILISQ